MRCSSTIVCLLATATNLFGFGVPAPQDPRAPRDWYVATTGKGKKATKEEPAKDLGSIADQIQPGDTVHLAAGTYTGRGDSGRDQVPPCTILGGYSPDFTERDPWGRFPTVLSGDNKAKNFDGGARLEIAAKSGTKGKPVVVVDGLVVDNGARNQYAGGTILQRKFAPKTGENASPESPGILVAVAMDDARITIQNCVVLNCGPTGKRGAIEVKAHKNAVATIRNNLVINNTSGIACLSGYHGKGQEGMPRFTVADNTVLFTWKYDPIATHGGTGLLVETVTCNATNNVFAFGDLLGVDNQCGGTTANLALVGNAFSGNLAGDYRDFDTVVALSSLEDDAKKLAADTKDNVLAKIDAAVAPAWATPYAARTVIDRQKAEADVEAANTRANELRRILGLPLDGGTLTAKSDVWMHRFPLTDALRIAQRVTDGRGCSAPSADTATPNK